MVSEGSIILAASLGERPAAVIALIAVRFRSLVFECDIRRETVAVRVDFVDASIFDLAAHATR